MKNVKEVIIAEDVNGNFEKEILEITNIDSFEDRVIYFHDYEFQTIISYDYEENIDWDFIERAREYFEL